MRCISTTTRSGKCPVRPPTHYSKRLLDENCPNHAYPIRHKLKDYGIMRSFMTSGSLTCGAELHEVLDGSNTTPFPEENAAMTVYRECPPIGGGTACLT
jgi:hypothetical protein